MSRFGRRFEDWYAGWKNDIFQYCRELNFEPTWQQRQALQIVQDETLLPYDLRKKRIATKSGHGTGKTTVSCVIASWRTGRYEGAMTVLTGPSMRQLKKEWFAEFRRLLKGAHPYLQHMWEVTATEARCLGDRDWCITSATASDPRNVQGYHEKHMTFVLDEASGVKANIWEVIKATVTNDDALVVAMGNPNTLNCEFYNCFTRNRALWHCLTFNAEESPIVSRTTLEQMATEYGRDSNVYRVRVLGEFPFMDPNCVVDLKYAEACTRTDKMRAAAIRDELMVDKALSYDFARYGGDENVMGRRSGLAVMEMQLFTEGKTDPSRCVMAGFRAQRDASWGDKSCVHIADAHGMGQGLLHRFTDANKLLFEFYSNGSSSKVDYANRITEAWFEFAKLLKRGIVHIPNDPRLLQQLTSRQYKLTDDGKFIVESKDDYIDRLRRDGSDDASSPDRADMIVMLFYNAVMTTARSAGRNAAQPRIGASKHRGGNSIFRRQQ